MRWATEGGNWTRFRGLPGLVEVDFHRSGQEGGGSYWENMGSVYEDALDALREAQEEGAQYVLFTHGRSTSSGWKQTTSRSVIRGLMRSPEATPYIDRTRCIQHESVFVAAIRPAILRVPGSIGTAAAARHQLPANPEPETPPPALADPLHPEPEE